MFYTVHDAHSETMICRIVDGLRVLCRITPDEQRSVYWGMGAFRMTTEQLL